MTRRLVCIVEGHGEVTAIPTLCARVLYTLLGREPSKWAVDRDPIRQPRSQLVDEAISSPNRPPRLEGVDRALGLALARPNVGAVMVVVDSDKDCAVAWGPPATERVRFLPAPRPTMFGTPRQGPPHFGTGTNRRHTSAS